jgi:hypothetical protein
MHQIAKLHRGERPSTNAPDETGPDKSLICIWNAADERGHAVAAEKMAVLLREYRDGIS